MASALALLSVLSAQSCGFPDHTFVGDDEFYGKAGAANHGGATGGTGTDASVGGASGGSEQGGQGQGGIGEKETGGTIGSGKSDGGISRGGGGAETGGSPGDSGTGDSGLKCGIGLTACSSACVDVLTDKSHCGNCTTACTGTDVCTKNGCAPPCGPGLTVCTPQGTSTSVCVDTTTDENNCSGCNKPCPSGFVCDASKCVVDCGDLTRCATQCYDTATDDLHCGDCTTNCRTLGQVCSGGHCQPNCTAPFVLCGSSCVNPTNDDLNCNGCGKMCGAKEGCIGGTCTALVENCTNGSDDDRDGLVDCADPDCGSGYTCASTPVGWTGPVAIWAGASGAAPACGASGGYPNSLLVANSGLNVPPYACPGCSCGVSAGAYCDTLNFVFDTSTNCSDQSPWQAMPFPPAASCTSTDQPLCCALNASARSVRLENAATSYAHGACTGSQAAPSFPPTSWSNQVRGCSAAPTSAGGCGGAQCVPKPTAPFGAELCVFRSGISTCPSDYPTQKPGPSQQYYQTVLEGRSCSTCSCGSPTCGGTLTLSSNDSCNADNTVLNLGPNNTCTTIAGDPTQTLLHDDPNNKTRVTGADDTRSYKFTNAGPVCGSAASTLGGAPKPDSPITVCCQGP